MLTVCLLLLAAQGADSLTLADALARARTSRPRLAAASAAVDRARGAARVATMIPNPSTQFESDNLSPTHKITATQPLAWLPRRSAERAAGRAGIARAEADSMQGWVDVMREARRAFFGAMAADQQAALAAEQSSLADSLSRLATRRAAAGDISDLERAQIALEAARARNAADQAREQAGVARVEFARAVAWGATPPPRPAGRLDEGLERQADARATEEIELLPSVRAAAADAAAATARLRSAQMGRVPTPGLLVGREWGSLASGGGNTIIGFVLSVPLWSVGNEAVALARGAAAEQEAIASEARLSARAAIAAAGLRLSESRRRAIAARDSLLPEAQRIRAGAVRLYEEGRTSVLPVLDALRAERDVARLAVAEQLAFQEARVALDAALGRS